MIGFLCTPCWTAHLLFPFFVKLKLSAGLVQNLEAPHAKIPPGSLQLFQSLQMSCIGLCVGESSRMTIKDNFLSRHTLINEGFHAT